MTAFTVLKTSDVEAPARRWVLDARVKLLLLIAYSLAVFACSRWSGMVLFAVGTIGLLPLLKGQQKKFFTLLAPVVGLSLMVVFIRLIDTNVHTTLADLLASGLIALRFVLLAAGSLYVALTTGSTQLMNALRWLLSPLQRCGIRTQSAVTVLTMAVSFIPRIADDFRVVYAAQRCRGAAFTTGGLVSRLRNLSRLFIPMFISIFRHADHIALAMEARCYGAFGVRPTALNAAPWTWRETTALVGGLALCILAVVL